MTSFNSIWTTSFNQALLLKNNGIPSISGVSPTTSAGATGASGGSLAGIEPLDLLLGQVSKSVSGVMSSFSLTKGMNFSKSFSSAFTPSPFQKSLTTLNNTLAASSISTLAKGVFSEATSAASMTRAEKENLMTAILSGVNLGFMSATSLMQTMNIMTGMIQQSLDSIQSNVRTSVDSYYTAYTNNALPGQTAVFAASATTTPATSTPSSTTTTTPSTTPTTPAPPSVPATTSGSTASGTASGSTGTTGSAPTPAPSAPAAPQIDQAILDEIKGMQRNPFGFGSGTFSTFSIDYGAKLDFMADAKGINHSIYTDLTTSTYIVDERTVINGSPDQYIQSLEAFKFKDASGVEHSLKGNWDGSKIDSMSLDGNIVTANELANWAKTAGLKVDSTAYGNTYYANIERQGVPSIEQVLVYEDHNGYYNTLLDLTYYPSGLSSVTIEAASGQMAVFGVEYFSNQYLNGKPLWSQNIMTPGSDAEELLKWAESAGAEKQTVTQNGKTIDISSVR